MVYDVIADVVSAVADIVAVVLFKGVIMLLSYSFLNLYCYFYNGNDFNL